MRPEERNCGSFAEITSLKEGTGKSKSRDEHPSRNLYEIRFSIPRGRHERSLLFPSLSLFLSSQRSKLRVKIETPLRRALSGCNPFAGRIAGGKGMKKERERERDEKKKKVAASATTRFYLHSLTGRDTLSRRRARIEIAELSRGKITASGYFPASSLADFCAHAHVAVL